MIALRKHLMPALAVLAGSALLAIAAGTGDAARGQAPALTRPASPTKAPDPNGFLQRWLLLEPIRVQVRSNQELTDSFVQAAIKKEYFPNQFTVIPHDGDKVTVGDAELTWHAVDTNDYNVNLYHFAYGSGQADLQRRVLGRHHRQLPAGDARRAPGRRLQLGLHLVGERQGSH